MYINPSTIKDDNGYYYNSRLEFIKRLEEKQIQRDRDFMSFIHKELLKQRIR